METNIYDRSWGRQRLTKLEFWEYFHRASHTIKITHMWRRWGTPQNYCLAFIDELEKQLFIKKCWILIHNFFKKKKDTCRYYYFTPVYQKSWWYDLQFLRYRVWQTEFWQIELWKNEKKKKFPEISFYTCSKNHNHTRYGCWDRKSDRQNFLLFWAIFCPFTHLTRKKQNFEKIKKKATGYVITVQMCTKNHNHMMYASWDMECNRHNFVILGHFLPFYPTIDPGD